MKKFTVGTKNGEPVILLNGVEQDTHGYMPWQPWLTKFELFGQFNKHASREEIVAESDWLLMHAKRIRMRACKMRKAIHDNPAPLTQGSPKQIRLRDLMMFSDGD